MKLYPSITWTLLAFQLLHIWFKERVYFSWWLLIPLIVVYWLLDMISDKLKKSVDRHFSKECSDNEK